MRWLIDGYNVILRDATTWSVIASMYRGRRIIYCDFQGYDEVGHFAGPETGDAVGTLKRIDRQIRQIMLVLMLRGGPVMTSNRQVAGNVVTWAEHDQDLDLNVEAVVKDGKIQSLVYRDARAAMAR